MLRHRNSMLVRIAVFCILIAAATRCGGAGDVPTHSTAVPPTIAQQPQNQSVTAPAPATFSVLATGTEPFSYQWRKNGNAIPGATQAGYGTPATAAIDSGSSFSVVVSNPAGSVTSASAILTVVSPSAASRLAYTCVHGSNGPDICASDGDGTHQVTVVTDVAADETPTWSPDGSRIAFVAGDYSTNLRALWVVDADGTNKKSLGVYPVHYPAWSPIGGKIAFAYGPIYTVNEDGSKLTRLLSLNTSADRPAWSPDAKYLAFGTYTDSGIWVVNADGTGQRQVTNRYGDFFPAWSPDGTQLVFGADGNIDVVNVDGSGRRRIYTKGNWGAGLPSWSKANQIAFSIGSAPGRIWIMNPDGTALHMLGTSNIDADRDPAWRPQ